MPSEADEEKLEKFMMSMRPSALAAFREVAKRNGTGIQDLLRSAADAIIEYHLAMLAQNPHAKRTVPLDMQLIQRPIGSLLGNASEEQLGKIIQERLEHTKWEVNEAGQLAAELAAEITRRGQPPESKRKTK